jgi:hypothetical protein
MKLRCWPGAIARMSDTASIPGNRGLLVEVIEHSMIGSAISGEYCWSVVAIGRPGYAEAGPTQSGFVADRMLTPITPADDVVEQVKEAMAA